MLAIDIQIKSYRIWPTHQVLQLDSGCCAGDRSLWAQQPLISRCFAGLSPISSIYLSCDQT